MVLSCGGRAFAAARKNERMKTMDRKTERKLRLRSLKLRSAIFFKRNGLYIGAFAFLAMLGAAALLLLNGPDPGTPVRRSDDERLSDAVSVSPSPAAQTPAPSSDPRTAAPTAAVPNVPTLPPRTPIPDFSPAPSPDPGSAPHTITGLNPPVDGHVIRSFAVNSLIWSETLQQWMTHPGVDISGNKGDPVYAVLAGSVEKVYTDDMLGVTVVIAHDNGLTSVYSGLKDAPQVRQGDAVALRQIVGHIGDTAIGECAERSHLHFELLYNGSPIDPESVIIFDKQ